MERRHTSNTRSSHHLLAEVSPGNFGIQKRIGKNLSALFPLIGVRIPGTSKWNEN
jgi:hypothetical protein